MNKYLIELIQLQKSVILPGLGALMIGNSKSGKIVFNGHLKFNDGALAKFVAQKEGIDVQAAQNQVAKFVREIEAELNKGNSFDIFQFGKFSKKKDGSIDFVQDAATLTAHTDSSKTHTNKPVEKTATVASKPLETKKTEEHKPLEVKKTEEIKPVEAKKLDEIKKTISHSEPIKAEHKVSAPLEANKPVEKSNTESLQKSVEEKANDLTSQLKASEAISKIADVKEDLTHKKASVEDSIPKQAKNVFVPASEKAADSIHKIEKGVEKPIEISKTIPLADASKKDPVAQEKNSFKPSEEIAKPEAKPSEKTESKPVEQFTDKLVAASESGTPKDAEKNKDGKPSKKEEAPKKESVKEKFKKDKPQKIKHEDPEKKPKKKKKRRAWVWIVLLLILGGGGTAGWFYKDQIQSFLYAGVGDDADTTKTAAHAEDSVAHTTDTAEEIIPEDTLSGLETETETVVEEVKVQPVTHHSSGGSHHIIGNSFSSETNASNYVKKMSEKGYPAENIGKFNGLYLVSLKSFGSKEEAKNNLESVKADAASAYVFTIK